MRPRPDEQMHLHSATAVRLVPLMTAVRTRSIRHELTHFFSKARPFDGKLEHTPIVVLQTQDDGEVLAWVTRFPELLLALPDDTRCIQAWPGAHRSDLFTYTVAEARAEIDAAIHRRMVARAGHREVE